MFSSGRETRVKLVPSLSIAPTVMMHSVIRSWPVAWRTLLMGVVTATRMVLTPITRSTGVMMAASISRAG